MSDSIFEEGGPHKIKRIGQDRYELNVSLPTDDDGMTGRECPSSICEPAYFKVKPGTGIKNQEFAYCPYCSQKEAPDHFHTAEQNNYVQQIVQREALVGINKMMFDTLELDQRGERTIDGGLVSFKISVESSDPPPVPRPWEEELRRNLICPHCSLEHAVFGLAIWCPDCGKNIFLTHVEGEFNVIRKMINDIDSRKERLGARIAIKDTENALEDVVSTFEAVLRVITKLHLRKSGKTEQETDQIVSTQVGNKFQNIEIGATIFQDLTTIPLLKSLTDDEIDFLKLTFEKRHPITHNLGIIDRKYLQKVRSGELKGREVRVRPSEILTSIELCLKSINNVYQNLLD